MNCIKIIILSSMCISGLSAGGSVSKGKQEGVAGVAGDVGRNAGVGAVVTLFGCFSKTGAWIATGTVVAAPYVVGGTAVAGIGYGGYRLYRYYHRPTPQQRILADKARTELIKSQMELIKSQNKLEKLQREQQLKNCLLQHQKLKRNPQGVPDECTKTVLTYAVISGTKVDEIIAAFKKHAPQQENLNKQG